MRAGGVAGRAGDAEQGPAVARESGGSGLRQLNAAALGSRDRGEVGVTDGDPDAALGGSAAVVGADEIVAEVNVDFAAAAVLFASRSRRRRARSEAELRIPRAGGPKVKEMKTS